MSNEEYQELLMLCIEIEEPSSHWGGDEFGDGYNCAKTDIAIELRNFLAKYKPKE